MKNLTFEQFLVDNLDAKIYLDPCKGNNGDSLILLGMKLLLDKVGSKVVSQPESSSLIIINGGGMFIDAYSQGVEKLKYYTNKFPNKNICIAPNSFFYKTDDFKNILDGVENNLTIFSREKFSKIYIDKIIENKKNLVSYIDHDLAFSLAKSPFLEQLKSKKEKIRSLLVVDRTDIENFNRRGKNSTLRQVYSKVCPFFIKQMLKYIRREYFFLFGSKYKKKSISEINMIYPDAKIEDVLLLDISKQENCNFDEFVDYICYYEYIVTNRLHVAIMACMLDKKVIIHEGSYYKNKGIYDYSMKHNLHVSFMEYH
jgi:exopolysaccharide biosynthesis predicted pyruvyltransferase EpsI